MHFTFTFYYILIDPYICIGLCVNRYICRGLKVKCILSVLYKHCTVKFDGEANITFNCTIKFGAAVHVAVFPQTLFSFQSYTVFSFRGSAGLSGC
jgi:hypothetical protein